MWWALMLLTKLFYVTKTKEKWPQEHTTTHKHNRIHQLYSKLYFMSLIKWSSVRIINVSQHIHTFSLTETVNAVMSITRLSFTSYISRLIQDFLCSVRLLRLSWSTAFIRLYMFHAPLIIILWRKLQNYLTSFCKLLQKEKLKQWTSTVNEIKLANICINNDTYSCNYSLIDITFHGGYCLPFLYYFRVYF